MTGSVSVIRLLSMVDMTGCAGSVECRCNKSADDLNVIMVLSPSYKLVKRFVWPEMARWEVVI